MRDLIVFGEDFGGLPSSTQHLVRHLAKEHKVLWVNSIGLRQPKLSTKDATRAFNKLFGKTKAVTQNMLDSDGHDNITIVNLKTIPAPASKFSRQLAQQMMLHQLKPVIAELNLNEPILWTSLPTAVDLCGHLGESSVVYYCGDDFSALAGVDHDTVAQHESELIDKATLIFAASKKLMDKFPKHKSHLLPHGVDVDLFSTPAPRANDLPSNHRPIAGFYGSLSKWLDYEMIGQVANAMPEWDFVFIGPNELDTLMLPKLSNVHYLGPRPHHTLPSYSQHWDVSLLPFVDNEQIRACSPLKLMEYLAAGTPIITTPFPALVPYQEHVTTVGSTNQMIWALDHARQLSNSPISVVEQESWQNRGNFVHWMLELL
ncbi:glycosyltransferase [Vibrio sp. Sgm 22]|uniref:glycosyltransferase n=1 Tax=unclassified Vibrio TaxID=2614977 RepID=UPI002057207D|nr:MULTISPECIES: glycosyltransferase [Vibrio]MCX2757659.1 glycosyltransferase [Vibrio sp. 14G-20]MCX2775063.1 glycosyltransferase [Vibrio sp. Sgm 22]UPR48925.1 glycosyltransferase [Vibrio cyclitrophicus]